MTINERIKYFRKDVLHINQKQLATELGMTQSGVSYIEQLGSNVSDSSIKTICTMYNLNENWLRYGEEPMHIESPTFSLDEFCESRGATELEMDIVKAYFELEPDIRKMLLEHFKERLSKSNLEKPYDIHDDIPDTPEELERRFPPVDVENESGVG